MNKKDLAKYIDHTLLKATATEEDILNLCGEAKKYQFFSVCINPCWVALAKTALEGTNIKVCTVIGFPLGANHTSLKQFETETAIIQGADEIDMVINVGYAKKHQWDLVEKDIASVVSIAKETDSNKKIIVKVILETCYLTDEEIENVCLCAKNAGADFVKTSTGFGNTHPNGATAEQVTLMKKVVGKDLCVKASGGIRDTETALAMIKAGATRLGTSASVAIVT